MHSLAKPNKSLERTTAESAFFHSPMLGGRRSALRWTLLGTQKESSQMSAFDCRDSNILGRYAPVAVGHRFEKGRSSFHKAPSAHECGIFMLAGDDSPLSFTGAMESRRSPAPVSEAESNKSLERTPVEQSCFPLTDVCGRRSAHRWTHLMTEKEASQMSAFDCRDSSILGRYAPVAVGHRSESGRSSFQKAPSAHESGVFMLAADDSPLSFTGAMESRRSHAPVSEAESNKSLERTTAESAFLHSPMLGGRRSALR